MFPVAVDVNATTPYRKLLPIARLLVAVVETLNGVKIRYVDAFTPL